MNLYITPVQFLIFPDIRVTTRAITVTSEVWVVNCTNKIFLFPDPKNVPYQKCTLSKILNATNLLDKCRRSPVRVTRVATNLLFDKFV